MHFSRKKVVVNFLKGIPTGPDFLRIYRPIMSSEKCRICEGEKRFFFYGDSKDFPYIHLIGGFLRKNNFRFFYYCDGFSPYYTVHRLIENMVFKLKLSDLFDARVI